MMIPDSAFTVDRLTVWTHPDTAAMARRAAADVAAAIEQTIAQRGEANLIVSGAESQQAFHAALVARMLEGPISPALPASLLRTKDGARLYLDRESSAVWLTSRRHVEVGR